MRKRIASIFLTLVLTLTLLPVQVLAEDTAYTVGEDTEVSVQESGGAGGGIYIPPAGTELKADNIDAYLANGLGDGVYTLAEDVTITGVLSVTGDATVDLNGHVLRFDQNAPANSIFRVTSGSTLTLDDSDPTAAHTDAALPAGGLITGGKGFKHDNGAGQSFSYFGGGVYVNVDASFVLEGGTIYDCGIQSGAYMAFGGGVFAEGGSVTINGGAIRNCAVSGDSSASGGGVYIRPKNSWPSFTMTGGVISGCSAMSGGGIMASGSAVRITGGSIENCKATNNGGGLYVSGNPEDGQAAVLDAAISGCEAENGGGLYLGGFTKLELRENARITGCKATNGAAVYMGVGKPYAVNYPGCFLYANGGRVEGTVYVGTNWMDQNGEIKATNAIDHTDGQPTTVFTGDVSCEGDIRGGIFYGSVTVTDSADNMGTAWEKFCGNISGGTFYGPVTTECHVSGGTYYAGLTMNKNARLSGQPIDTGDVINEQTNTPEPNVTPATVTYWASGAEYAKQLIRRGTKVTAPDDPQKDGWTFVAWLNGGGAIYNFDSSIYGDVTFTAKWRKALSGAGTAQDPYRISTAEELGLFRDTVNGDGGRGQNTACAVLTADIDLQNQLWTPIGNGQYPYGGTFDGGGHTIKNLNVNTGASHAGLFGDAHNAVFKDLTVAGSVTGTSSYTSGYAGGLLGNGTGAITITNCINLAAVTSGEMAGGLVGIYGDADNELTITGCANFGTVTAEMVSAGIISQVDGHGLISDCYNAGEVKIIRSKGFTFLGGIAGWISVRGNDAAKTLTLRSCYSVGALTAPDAEDIGGIVAYITTSGSKEKDRYRLENCYYLNTTADLAAASGNEDKYTVVGEVASKHAVRFGDGTVLTALIAGRGDGEHPWNSRCQYLAAVNRTIPVFANQNGDGHTHQVSTKWEGDATGHWRACACGWPEDESLHHTMDDGDCTTPETCTECGYTIAANPAHTWGGRAFNNGDGTHTRRCTVCLVGRMAEPCTDADKNHRCDACGAVLSQCVDANKDHKCDYCDAVLSQCTDADKDHKCDVCDAVLSQCADADKDHKCDYCGKTISNHADADKDHKCDYCGKTISNHADADKDHKCDYCGKTTSNHTGGTATCTAQAVCTYCGSSYGVLDPDNHSALRHVTSRAATRDRDGRIEHWRCNGCGRYFSDAAATLPITRGETVLPRLGDTASAAAVQSAATGDSGVALWLVLLTGSAAAAAVTVCCGKKRRENR